MQDDAAGGTTGPELSHVERKVRNATSNDIDDATYLQLDELTRLTHDSNACGELVRAVSTRLVTHFDSWRRVLKSLMLIDYLLHTGSELFVSHLRDNVAAIHACLSYTSIEERERDRAPGIRQAAQRLESLLVDESKLATARRAAALILGVVSTGKLRGDSESTTNSQAQARISAPRATMAIAKDNVYYRSFIGVPDLSHELSDLSERLGSGGFADVHSAFWNRSGAVATKVAVKVIRNTDAGEEPIFQARHAREISVWHEVRHENILPLYGLHWELGSLPAMVSPWCGNGDLKKYIRAKQSYEDIDGLKLKLLEDVLQGLKYLHEYHPVIVHADIKGANVLISNEGVACLSDFGLASVLAEHSKSFTLHTMAKGTIRWMAPELFAEDASRHTTHSDVWAVGCLLLEVQTGRAPYCHLDNDAAVMRALGQRMWPSRTDDTPDRLWWLILECCNPDPSQRPLASHILLSLQELRKLQTGNPSAWRARHVFTAAPCMHSALALRLTTHIVEDLALEDRLNSIYMDDVWLQAVHVSITGERNGGAALSSQTGGRAVAAALRVCIGRLWSLTGDIAEDRLAQTVAIAVIDAALEQRFGISDTTLELAKRPVKEVEVLATLLSQCHLKKHAEWVEAHLTNQFLVQPFHGHKGAITSLAFSPDGKFVISVDSDHVMHILDSATGLRTAGPRKHPTSKVVMLAASLCARRIATLSENAGIQVWNGETGARILDKIAHQPRITCIAISPDGNYIIAANHRDWYMWEADTGRLLHGPCDAEEKGHKLCRPEGFNTPVHAPEMGPFSHRTHIASISFSCEGHRFVCVTCSGWITRWDTHGASQAPVHSGRISGLLHEGKCAISPDLRLLAGQYDSADREFGIWDTSSFQRLFCFSDQTDETLWTKSLTFANHGVRLVTVHNNWSRTRITGWDSDTEWSEYVGEEGWVGRSMFNIDLDEQVEVAISSTNPYIAAGSKVDGTVRMWDSSDHRFATEIYF